ncbi:MAG: pseudouridine synthase [bacterium]|nr:rRNA pseudouridine synthase [bacterium]MBU1919042.1 rRNA pseudouridine synthase [bacterium]
MKERIQKVIASTGVFSRRAVEKLIDEKKIKINGIIVTTKGMKIDPTKDRIQIDGKAFKINTQEEFVAILINKPRQVMVTRSDPEKRKCIFDLLPEEMAHLKPVGRLDYNTQGAIILTNDGEFILHLTHPKYHLEKVYELKTTNEVTDKQINRLRKGIVLDGSRTLPAQIRIMRRNKTSSILEFVLVEGKNRQIRRMCQTVGISVKELKRISIGPVKLGTLKSGGFRRLTLKELQYLRDAIISA